MSACLIITVPASHRPLDVPQYRSIIASSSTDVPEAFTEHLYPKANHIPATSSAARLKELNQSPICTSVPKPVVELIDKSEISVKKSSKLIASKHQQMQNDESHAFIKSQDSSATATRVTFTSSRVPVDISSNSTFPTNTSQFLSKPATIQDIQELTSRTHLRTKADFSPNDVVLADKLPNQAPCVVGQRQLPKKRKTRRGRPAKYQFFWDALHRSRATSFDAACAQIKLSNDGSCINASLATHDGMKVCSKFVTTLGNCYIQNESDYCSSDAMKSLVEINERLAACTAEKFPDISAKATDGKAVDLKGVGYARNDGAFDIDKKMASCTNSSDFATKHSNQGFDNGCLRHKPTSTNQRNRIQCPTTVYTLMSQTRDCGNGDESAQEIMATDLSTRPTSSENEDTRKNSQNDAGTWRSSQVQQNNCEIVSPEHIWSGKRKVIHYDDPVLQNSALHSESLRDTVTSHPLAIDTLHSTSEACSEKVGFCDSNLIMTASPMMTSSTEISPSQLMSPSSRMTFVSQSNNKALMTPSFCATSAESIFMTSGPRNMTPRMTSRPLILTSQSLVSVGAPLLTLRQFFDAKGREYEAYAQQASLRKSSQRSPPMTQSMETEFIRKTVGENEQDPICKSTRMILGGSHSTFATSHLSNGSETPRSPLSEHVHVASTESSANSQAQYFRNFEAQNSSNQEMQFSPISDSESVSSLAEDLTVKSAVPPPATTVHYSQMVTRPNNFSRPVSSHCCSISAVVSAAAQFSPSFSSAHSSNPVSQSYPRLERPRFSTCNYPDVPVSGCRSGTCIHRDNCVFRNDVTAAETVHNPQQSAESRTFGLTTKEEAERNFCKQTILNQFTYPQTENAMAVENPNGKAISDASSVDSPVFESVTSSPSDVLQTRESPSSNIGSARTCRKRNCSTLQNIPNLPPRNGVQSGIIVSSKSPSHPGFVSPITIPFSFYFSEQNRVKQNAPSASPGGYSWSHSDPSPGSSAAHTKSLGSWSEPTTSPSGVRHAMETRSGNSYLCRSWCGGEINKESENIYANSALDKSVPNGLVKYCSSRPITSLGMSVEDNVNESASKFQDSRVHSKLTHANSHFDSLQSTSSLDCANSTASTNAQASESMSRLKVTRSLSHHDAYLHSNNPMHLVFPVLKTTYPARFSHPKWVPSMSDTPQYQNPIPTILDQSQPSGVDSSDPAVKRRAFSFSDTSIRSMKSDSDNKPKYASSRSTGQLDHCYTNGTMLHGAEDSMIAPYPGAQTRCLLSCPTPAPTPRRSIDESLLTREIRLLRVRSSMEDAPLDLSVAAAVSSAQQLQQQEQQQRQQQQHSVNPPSALHQLQQHQEQRHRLRELSANFSHSSPQRNEAKDWSVTSYPSSERSMVRERELIAVTEAVTGPVQSDVVTQRWRSDDVMGIGDVTLWSVDDVVRFVSGVAGCEQYAEKFGQELVDGPALVRLSEDHLVRYIGMRLGPAVALRAALQRRDVIRRA